MEKILSDNKTLSVVPSKTEFAYGYKGIEHAHSWLTSELEYLQTSDLPLVLYGAGTLAVRIRAFLDFYNIKVNFWAVDKEYLLDNLEDIESVLSHNFNANVIVAFEYNCENKANALTNLSGKCTKVILPKRMMPQQLPFLVFKIIQHCNLNCMSCNQCSPIAEKEFMDLSKFEQDIQKISKLTSGYINIASLLGGEPLLHPDIIRFMEIYRKYIPGGSVCICTNGILLSQMEEDFWLACKDNNFFIEISKYPIKLDVDKIFEIARKYGVYIEYVNDKTEFFSQKFDENGKYDNRNCSFGICHILENSKIYKCSFLCGVKHLEKQFGVNLPISESDYLVLDELNNVNEILDFFHSPSIPFCKYCVPQVPMFSWKVSEKKKEEWVI